MEEKKMDAERSTDAAVSNPPLLPLSTSLSNPFIGVNAQSMAEPIKIIKRVILEDDCSAGVAAAIG